MFKRRKGFRRGGVHPPDMKYLTRMNAICQLPIPNEIVIPLTQHIGSSATALVEIGDKVKKGQKVGEPSGYISAAVHSSVDGEVIATKKVVLPNGLVSNAIVIKPSDTQSDFPMKQQKWKNLSSAQLLGEVVKAGIVGAGGATFPTHIKLSVPKGKKVEYLVINAVECEPYLNADNRLILEFTKEILEGISILKKIVNATKVIIGIEKNKPAAISLLKEEAFNHELNLEVVALKVKYPQGDEKQLLQALIGREVPSGALPIEVGAVVINVGTTFAVYEAVVFNKPFFERVLTVSGKSVKNAGNYRVAIGTSFAQVIEASGGLSDKTAKLVAGGPMMGFAFFDLDQTPVIKGTSGILVLSQSEVNQSVRTSCLNCGKCIKTCPMGLHPTGMFRLLFHNEFEKVMKMGLMDCKECGCCSYICPAQIPLVHGFKMAKRESRKLQRGQA